MINILNFQSLSYQVQLLDFWEINNIFSTSTNEIVIGLTHIPNLFLHHRAHPVHICLVQLFRITVIGNRNIQWQEKLILESTSIVQ